MESVSLSPPRNSEFRPFGHDYQRQKPLALAVTSNDQFSRNTTSNMYPNLDSSYNDSPYHQPNASVNPNFGSNSNFSPNSTSNFPYYSPPTSAHFPSTSTTAKVIPSSTTTTHQPPQPKNSVLAKISDYVFGW